MSNLRPLRPSPSPDLVAGLRGPALRRRFESELDGSRRVDLAISHIRLTTLGSIPGRLLDLDGIRLVLGQLRADALDAEAHALAVRPGERARLRVLVQLVDSGRIEVRAAPLGGWSPDFSVFEPRARLVTRGRGEPVFGGEPGVRALVGSHAFGLDGPDVGPLLAIPVGGAEGARIGAAFEAIWARSHVVTPALSRLLRRALRWAEIPRREELRIR